MIDWLGWPKWRTRLGKLYRKGDGNSWESTPHNKSISAFLGSHTQPQDQRSKFVGACISHCSFSKGEPVGYISIYTRDEQFGTGWSKPKVHRVTIRKEQSHAGQNLENTSWSLSTTGVLKEGRSKGKKESLQTQVLFGATGLRERLPTN